MEKTGHKQPFQQDEVRRVIPRGAGPELMAPAGGPEAGYAAFAFGADSIYLGLPQFSARAEACNFTLEQVEAITAFAHAQDRPRRVFAALNTLIRQNELDNVIAALGALSDIGVDALIVQDLGLLRMARRHFPEFRLHASTQMAVHNRAGVEMLRELGCTRVTLARELTIGEIRDCSSAPGIETEVFIHGALCYSYSGLCLMSSHMLGRSGNRGRCAYLCRDRFSPAESEDGRFIFNMKDLALPDHVESLRSAGVASLKIEGRMKSPLYVAATVNFYRKLLDGSLAPDEREQFEADIRTIFSRPWTTLYIDGQRNPDVIDMDTVGHRGMPAGEVQSVRRDRKTGAFWLNFTAARPIERHDGLQLDLQGRDWPFGFAVDELRVNGRSAFEASEGASIEVRLPDDCPRIPAGAAVFLSSSQAVKRKYRFEMPRPGLYRARCPVEISLNLSRKSLKVMARVQGDASITAGVEQNGRFHPAKDPAKTESAARQAFEKLGETRLQLAFFELHNPEGLFAPVSIMNALRRQVAEKIEMRLAETRQQRLQTIRRAVEADCNDTAITPLHAGSKIAEPSWSIKTDNPACLDAMEDADWRGVEEVVLELSACEKDIERLAAKIGCERIRLALPLIARAWETPALQERVARLQSGGRLKWEATGLASWRQLAGLPARDLAADWSVYVTNIEAAMQVMEMGANRFTLSPEDSLENCRLLLARFSANASVIIYQDTPLFISENCTRVERRAGCPCRDASEAKETELRSSHNDRLLMINRACRTTVISRSPFCLAGRLDALLEANATRFRADFIARNYNPEEVVAIWRSLRAGRAPKGSHCGNFDRGLM